MTTDMCMSMAFNARGPPSNLLLHNLQLEEIEQLKL